MTRLKILFTIPILFAVNAYAAGHTHVRVTFGIKSGHEYDTFAPADAATLKSSVVQAVRNELGKAFPAFDFSSTVPDAAHLHIGVDDDELGPTGSVQLVLAVDPEHFPEREYRIELRAPGIRGNPPGVPEAFAAEISGRLRRFVKFSRQDMVANVLRYIPIATSAFCCLAQQRMFILPFTAAEIEIGQDSRFEIRARDAEADWPFEAQPAGAAPASLPIPSNYHSKLRARALGPPDSLQRLSSPTGLRPIAVFVTRYEHEIPKEVRPSEFDPSGGSR